MYGREKKERLNGRREWFLERVANWSDRPGFHFHHRFLFLMGSFVSRVHSTLCGPNPHPLLGKEFFSQKHVIRHGVISGKHRIKYTHTHYDVMTHRTSLNQRISADRHASSLSSSSSVFHVKTEDSPQSCGPLLLTGVREWGRILEPQNRASANSMCAVSDTHFFDAAV